MGAICTKDTSVDTTVVAKASSSGRSLEPVKVNANLAREEKKSDDSPTYATEKERDTEHESIAREASQTAAVEVMKTAATQAKDPPGIVTEQGAAAVKEKEKRTRHAIDNLPAQAGLTVNEKLRIAAENEAATKEEEETCLPTAAAQKSNEEERMATQKATAAAAKEKAEKEQRLAVEKAAAEAPQKAEEDKKREREAVVAVKQKEEEQDKRLITEKAPVETEKRTVEENRMAAEKAAVKAVKLEMESLLDVESEEEYEKQVTAESLDQEGKLATKKAEQDKKLVVAKVTTKEEEKIASAETSAESAEMKGELDGKVVAVKSLDTQDNLRVTHKCTVCCEEKDKSLYSTSQWKKNRKKGNAKCLACVAAAED